MPKAHIKIAGHRATRDVDAPLTRGQDVGIYLVDRDGKEHLMPCVRSAVVRLEGRSAIATIEVEVDDMDIASAWLAEVTAATSKPE